MSTLTPDTTPLGTFGVTVASVAAELPALFASGFSADSTPSADLVRTWILDADDAVVAAVRALGAEPVPTLRTAQRLVIAKVIVQVMAAVWLGNDPESLARAVQPYRDAVKDLTATLVSLGAQLTGGTVQPSGVRFTFGDRTPLIDDAQLDGNRRIRSAT